MTPTEKKRKFILNQLTDLTYEEKSFFSSFPFMCKKYSKNDLYQELQSMDKYNDNLLHIEVVQNLQGAYSIIFFRGVDSFLTSKGEDYLQHVKWNTTLHVLRIIQNWIWPVITSLIVYCLTHK